MGLLSGIKNRIQTKAKKDQVLARILTEYYYWVLQRKTTLTIRGDTILNTIDDFLNSEQKSDKKYLRKVEKDMLFSQLYYQIRDREYFLYHFEDLSDEGRKKYMGHYELMGLYRQLNKKGNPELFTEKSKTYEMFKPFYKRDVLKADNNTQREEIIEFILDHNPCVLKPLKDYGGKGIHLINVNDRKDAESIYESYSSLLPFLLEEKIEQDPEMAIFHPQSINTIRYNTFFYDDKLIRLQAVFRIGQGGSFVDNASSGGIYAVVDTETGIIKSAARSYKGECYLIHPTTGEQIIGRHIPRWDELNQLLEEIVRIVPEQKQVGWDFALSTQGWIMVEGNAWPDMQSFDCENGMRNELLEIYSECL